MENNHATKQSSCKFSRRHQSFGRALCFSHWKRLLSKAAVAPFPFRFEVPGVCLSATWARPSVRVPPLFIQRSGWEGSPGKRETFDFCKGKTASREHVDLRKYSSVMRVTVMDFSLLRTDLRKGWRETGNRRLRILAWGLKLEISVEDLSFRLHVLNLEQLPQTISLSRLKIHADDILSPLKLSLSLYILNSS